MAKIYLAGPLGFTDSGRHYHETILRPAVEGAGYEVLDPWEYGEIRFGMVQDATNIDELDAANHDCGEMNATMIRDADAVLAVLDGSDVDSGTAAEIGFAAALGRPIIGIRSDLRMSGDNKATSINLQVAYLVRMSGGTVEESLTEALARLAQRLDD